MQRRLLTCVASASLALGGLALVGGCQHDKNGTYSTRGDTSSSDSARSASGGTYDATGQNMGQNPPGTYGPGQTGAAGSSGRYGPGTAAPNQQNTGGGYGNYGGVGAGSGTDTTGRNTGTGTGTSGSSSGTSGTGGSAGSSGGSSGGGGR